jgi:hypothetical protein
LVVVQAEAGDSAHQRPFDHVGRVEPTAQSDFDDAGVGGGASKGEEGHRSGHLEEARFDFIARVEHFGEQSGEEIILDQLAGEADAFVEPHQVRAGENMTGEARRLDCGAEEGAGRAFAVGAGDVKHRRK